jgi:GAF domain-containing protein
MVPLLSKGRIMGGLSLWSRQVAAYGPREQAIMVRLADQVAPAVENAGLYQELQTSIEEKAVVDEVARIVTSTLDIDQVHDKFASEVKKLVDFDRMTISVIDHEAGTFSGKYISGVQTEGRGIGAVVPLEGSGVERMLRTGRPVLRQDIRIGESLSGDHSRLRTGLLASVSVPLLTKSRITGTLTVHSHRAGAFGPREQAILERLADQIAPAVENAWLHESLQEAHDELESRVEARTEENAKLYEELQASTREKAVVDEVARTVTSTLDIDQVYEKFAAEVKKLVDFDRVTISLFDEAAGTFSPTYVAGVHMEGRDLHSPVPLEGTMVERVLRTGLPVLCEDIRTGSFSGDPARIKAGLYSCMTVPLFSKTQIVGTMTLQSCRVSGYGPKEQAILERLADHIAPAVENAELYRRLQQNIEEKAVLDEVARIVTTTLDIDEVYEKFTEEMKKLVDFDRVVLNAIYEGANSFTPEYMAGLHMEGRKRLVPVNLERTMVERVVRTGVSFLREDIGDGNTFPGDAARLQAGLRSSIIVPLFSKGRIVSTLVLLSSQASSYGPREQAILERLADQIAPAVENARLYDALQEAHRELESRIEARTAELTRANTSLQESEERFRGIFEASPVGVALADEEHRIIEANNAFCRMLGYTEEELIGGKRPILRTPRILMPARLSWRRRSAARSQAANWKSATSLRMGKPSGLGLPPGPSGTKRGSSSTRWVLLRTSPSASCCRSSWSRPRRWRSSASWLAGLPMTSTTC